MTGTYVGALLVGSTAVRMLQAIVDRLFGVVTGPRRLGVHAGIRSCV